MRSAIIVATALFGVERPRRALVRDRAGTMSP